MSHVIIITGDAARRAAIDAVMHAPIGHVAITRERKRTLDQNAAQWPWLEGYAQQVEIPINGAVMKVDNDTWKHILTAAFNGEQMRFAAYHGKTILLPERTSQMGKRRFSEWMEWLVAEATTNGVTPVFKNAASPREYGQ